MDLESRPAAWDEPGLCNSGGTLARQSALATMPEAGWAEMLQGPFSALLPKDSGAPLTFYSWDGDHELPTGTEREAQQQACFLMCQPGDPSQPQAAHAWVIHTLRLKGVDMKSSFLSHGQQPSVSLGNE